MTRRNNLKTLAGFCLALFFQVSAAPAQEIHAPHCLYGCPSGSPVSNDLIFREIYVLSSNDQTKFADWVAYRVTRDTIGGTSSRNWKPDPALATNETLEPADYKAANAKLGTDRGHQVPLASFTNTPYWKMTNFLSNITPQQGALNQGVWVKLETAERNLAKAPGVDAVFVMSGPLYEGAAAPLPQADEAHLIPSAYWKVVALQDGKDIKWAGFIFDQATPRKADLCDGKFHHSLREIEERSGLNLFHALSPADQQKLETGPQSLLNELGCS